MVTSEAAVSVSVAEGLRGSPYQGLVPYSEDDAEFFFGRAVWTEIIADNLKAYRLTLLYGESGVGKSSVLRAGVAHRLREQAERNQSEHGNPRLAVAVFSSWRERPLAGLAACLGASTDQPESAIDLEAVLERCAKQAGGKVFVILDQFEEYFLYHSAEIDPFAAALAGAVANRDLRVSFLIAMREDALAKLDHFKGRIPNLFDNYLRIEHLDRDAAREAIVRPLARFNELRPNGAPVELEPALADAVLDEVEAGKLQVGQGSVSVSSSAARDQARIEAPYLQLVLTRLWQEEMDAGSRVLRLETLNRLGGAGGIVEAHLDAAMDTLSPKEQDVAAKVFRYLVTRSRTKIAHTASDLADWAGVPESELSSVLTKLSGGDVRILRPVGETGFEIYHDVLAEAVLAWRTEHEARNQLEEETRQAAARARRRLLKIGAVLGVLALAGAILLAIFAVSKANDASHQRDVAKKAEGVTALTYAARTQLENRLDVPLLLGLEAVNSNPKSPAARGSMIQALAAADESGADAILHGNTAWRSAAYSHDGRLLATGGADGSVHLWDVPARRPVGQLSSGHTGPVLSVAFAPDGLLATAGYDGNVRLWSPRDHKLLPLLRGQTKAVWSVAFSPDGRLLASGSADGTVRVWNVEKPEKPRFLEQLQPPRKGTKRLPAVLSIAFSSKGVLASGGWDKSIHLWNVDTGQQVWSLPGHTDWIDGLAFSPGGDRLASASFDHTVRVWDVRAHVQLRSFDVGDGHPVYTVAFSPTRPTIASAGSSGIVHIWDLKSGRQTALAGARGSVWSLAYSPNGDTLAAASDDQTVLLRNVKALAAQAPLSVGEKDAYALAFGPGGRTIATAGGDGKVRLWDVRTHEPLATFDGFLSPAIVSAVAFNQGGNVLGAASYDKTMRFWNPQTGAQLGQPLDAHQRYLSGIAFSPDGSEFASAGQDGTVRLWRTGGVHRELGPPLPAGTEPIYAVAFSHGGGMLASAGADGTVRLWNPKTHRKIGEPLRGHIDQVRSVAFSPDDLTLASAGDDGTVRLWDVHTHKLLATLRGHREEVYGVTFSHDGQMLASAGADWTVRLWDVRTRTLVATLTGHQAKVWGVAFSPDGQTLASASADTTVRLWPNLLWPSFTILKQRVCQLVVGGLTRAEWNALVPDVPYQSPCGSS